MIDIFSISIKSMDPRYYRKLTKGWIEPVLDGTEMVYRAGKHVGCWHVVGRTFFYRYRHFLPC